MANNKQITPETCWYMEACDDYGTQECSKYCIRFAEMLYLMKESGLPPKDWQPKKLWLPDEDEEAYCRLADIKDDVKSWVDDGGSLYLYSLQPGNGKTSWAIKLLHSYFNAIWEGNGLKRRGVFLNVPWFLQKSKDVIRKQDAQFEEMKTELLEVDLVVWDDIAACSLTDYEYQNILAIISGREFAGLANIYTSNVGRADLERLVGQRLASRIWGASERIEFRAPDARGLKE